MGFSRQEYWSGLPCPPPGDLPTPGIQPKSHVSCIGRQVLYHQRHLGSPCPAKLVVNSSILFVPTTRRSFFPSLLILFIPTSLVLPHYHPFASHLYDFILVQFDASKDFLSVLLSDWSFLNMYFIQPRTFNCFQLYGTLCLNLTSFSKYHNLTHLTFPIYCSLPLNKCPMKQLSKSVTQHKHTEFILTSSFLELTTTKIIFILHQHNSKHIILTMHQVIS